MKSKNININFKKGYLTYLCMGLVLIGILIPFFSSIGIATLGEIEDGETIVEVQKNLVDVSEEEKKILEELFLLAQGIEEMEKQKIEIIREIEDLNKEVLRIEETIAAETLVYNKNLKLMEDVLKAYQKSGPSSFIELILSSNNLKELLQRLNILGDITRNTNELLKSLEESKDKLISEKNKVMEKLALVEEQQKKLEETLEKNTALKKELENYLASLEGERAKYEDYLAQVELYWSQLKPLFAETTKIFSEMLHYTDLPPDTIKIEFSLSGVKGILEEKTFKEIVEKQTFPTKMQFEFSPDKLELTMPDKHLYLSGSFEIVDDRKLVYVVNEGSFFGMPLEKVSIEDLFSEGYMELDLSHILGKNKLKSIKINEDNIELQITPVLF